MRKAALKIVLDKVAALEAQLKEAEEKKQALKDQVEDCEAKLKRADSLIRGLGGEKTRWTAASARLAELFKNVTGDVVLSSGVIAYMGAFLSSYRERLSHRGQQCSEKRVSVAVKTSHWLIRLGAQSNQAMDYR